VKGGCMNGGWWGMEGVDGISYSRWDEVDSAVRVPMSLQVGV
jgi:hypothetical protein